MTGRTRLVAGAAGAALVGAAVFTTVHLWNGGIGAKPPGGPGGANPNPAAVTARPPEVAFVANWEVRYEDADAGLVEGKAIVDWEKSRAAVTFDSGSSKTTLAADDVTVDHSQTQVIMRLRQSGSQGTSIKPLNAGGTPMPTVEGQQLKVQPTDPSFATSILGKQTADSDGVRLVFRAGNFGALLGNWSYLADPITKRNASGSGRSGFFRILNDDELEDPHQGFIGEQSGVEQWWPLPAEIASSAVMEAQMAVKDGVAVYPYPYSFSFQRGRAPDDSAITRTLFVLGRNFPYDPVRGRVLQPFRWNDADGIKNYRILALSKDPNLDAKGKQLIEDGWKKTLQNLDNSLKQAARDSLDAAVIAVTLKPGVMPGPKRFSWEQGEGVWFLQFGDNTANAHFVRPIRLATANGGTEDEYERTPYVFFPETLSVEIQTYALLPQDTIPVQVGTRNALESAVTVNAERIAKGRAIYRVKPSAIVKSGGSYVWHGLKFNRGDRLVASVRMDDVAFGAQPEAQATAFVTPDELPNYSGAPANSTAADPNNVHLWKEALVMAARADQVDPNAFESLGKLAGHNLSVPGNIPITVGQHAAMLLLRSEFLTMMQEQEKYLDSIQSDQSLEAFRESLRPLMADRTSGPDQEDEFSAAWAKDHEYLTTIDDLNKLRLWLESRPIAGVQAALDALDTRKTKGYGKGTYFGELPVPGPGGGTWPYFTTYWNDKDLAFFFHGDPAKLREWRLKAARAVLARYKEAVKSTIAYVKAIPVSTIDRAGGTKFHSPAQFGVPSQDLLKLTGIGFGPVVWRILPELMMLDDANHTAAPTWIPDLNARAAVASVADLATAERASQDFSSAAWSAAIEIVSAALNYGGAGLIFNEATAELITAAANRGLLSWQLAEEFYDQFIAIPRDLEVFMGASAVLGADRLEEVNAMNTSIGGIVEGLAVNLAIPNVWGKIEADTSPISMPTHGALRLPSFGIPIVYAADPPRPQRRRLRSFAQRIWEGLGSISAERTIERLRGLSVETLKQWPKERVQPYLQLAERGADLERGGPASRAQVEAQAQVRRLKRELDHPEPPEPLAAIEYGGPPPDPKPPVPGKSGLPAVPAEPPKPAQKLAARFPAAVSRQRQLPFTGAPAKGSGLIGIEEKGKWVYYKAEGVDTNGEPLKLGEGASANVYAVTDVIGRPEDNLLKGDGVVLKIIKKDSPFGTPREQILRIKEEYDLLAAAKAHDSSIEFPEILEFHEDANPPYLIQRRLKFSDTLKQIEPEELMARVARPPYPFPTVGFPLPFSAAAGKPGPTVDQRFPRGMRKAVVMLYFTLAAQQLIGWDLSLKNIYFKHIAGDVWVAGILDIDHIVHIKKPKPSATTPMEKEDLDWEKIRRIRDNRADQMPSCAMDGCELKTSFEFMEKALELPYGGNLENRWIGFDAVKGTRIANLIEPELIAEVRAEFEAVQRARNVKK